ncbi:MAG: T9SS type A sorting domain-containing protein [Bacteroidetes bacterium]|nr:MAG: T9SS type A sorting domain-containing protein [Bacteroidota bacterium]
MKLFNVILILLIFVELKLYSEICSYQYLYPLPESRNNYNKTNLIFRYKEKIDLKTLSINTISVIGNKSGKHEGGFNFSDDNKTIVFKPNIPFTAGETVVINFNSGVKTLSGNELDPFSFRFFVSPLTVPLNCDNISKECEIRDRDFTPENFFLLNDDSLPSDFPFIKTNYSENPAPGYYYLTNIPDYGVKSNYSNYLILLDNTGKIAAYKKIGAQTNGIAFNFKRETNGQIVHQLFDDNSTKVIILNNNLQSVDSIVGADKNSSVNADVLLLSNGHRILLSYNIIPYDFSLITPGGNPNGYLQFSVIQEFDKNNNVVFNWRSNDYIPVTETYESLTTQIVDYIHTDNIVLDFDGNLLLSNSNLSNIIKVSRETGEIMWKLGGRNNDFTFTGEHEENAPNYFSYQNHVQRLQNGDITLFDNGKQHDIQYSRAVEYKLDESDKTCELIWEYRHNPDIYSYADGSFQVLENGGKLISWGQHSENEEITATELHPDNTIAMEFSLPSGQHSMKVLKYPWPSCEPIQVTIYELLEGNTYPLHEDNIGIIIKFKKLVGFLYNGLKAERYECGPIKPVFEDKAPLVFPYRVKMTTTMIDSVECEIRFNVADFPDLNRLQELVIYNKPNDTSIYYKQLSTLYDPSSNELIVNTDNFGDFIFCIPEFSQKPLPPKLISPLNNYSVNQNSTVQLNWTTKGYSKSSHLVVGTDSTFSSGIIIDTNLKVFTLNILKLNQGQKYFWKVQCINEAGVSEWSETWSFTLSPPFIEITNPAEGEAIYRDTLYYIIRWKKNIDDTVKLELFKNGKYYQLIKDSLLSQIGAYSWLIPQSLPYDSNYSIVITSKYNSQIFGESGKFSVSPVLNVENEITYNDEDVILYQNYPNPADYKTSFKFYLNKFSKVNLLIFDLNSRNIEDLFNFELLNGTYIIDYDISNLKPGIYIYQLNVNGRTYSGKMSVTR